MDDWKLGVVESRFAQLIWANAPIRSGDLVKLCGKALGWKKSTTYTVLKKLCDKGIFHNENGLVTVLLSQQQVLSRQSRQFVEETFSGSLPAFLAAFSGQDGLSAQEVDNIRSMIDNWEGGHQP